jgi:hypothetical protein
MANPDRIDAEKTREKVQAGTALLVCAYGSEEKFNMLPLEGAISLSSFQTRLPSMSKDQEIIFYCA